MQLSRTEAFLNIDSRNLPLRKHKRLSSRLKRRLGWFGPLMRRLNQSKECKHHTHFHWHTCACVI